jgi:LPS-assembly lipoprotein
MIRTALLSLLALTALGLSACGFTPLYGSPGVTNGLSAISVVAPDGRAGYLLREQLDDALAHRPDVPPAYRLTMTVNELRYARGVRVDNVANRYELNMTVNWRLLSIASGAEVHHGYTNVAVTYDSADQPYAAVAAQQDGQERAAAEIARKIQLDLAAWLAGKTPA